MKHEWQKDRKWVKVMNLEYPGRDIDVNVNGVGYQIQDNKKVNLPVAVINVLKNAMPTRYKMPKGGANMDEGEGPIPYKQPIYAVIELNDSDVEKLESESEKLKDEIVKAAS